MFKEGVTPPFIIVPGFLENISTRHVHDIVVISKKSGTLKRLKMLLLKSAETIYNEPMVAQALHNFSYKGTSYQAGDRLDVEKSELDRLKGDVVIIEEEKKSEPKRKQVKKIYKK